jgi:hypothetical protein
MHFQRQLQKSDCPILNLLRERIILRSSKNIGRKPLIPQSFKPLPRLRVVDIPTLLFLNPLLRNLDQRLLHTITNLPASTHEQLGPCIEQFNDVSPVVIQAVLHVFAALRGFCLA